MVFAVRCPASKCRKFMLVEDTDRGRTVPCLICKSPIAVPGATPLASTPAMPVAPITIPQAIPATPLKLPTGLKETSAEVHLPEVSLEPSSSHAEVDFTFEPDVLELDPDTVPLPDENVPVARRIPPSKPL